VTLPQWKGTPLPIPSHIASILAPLALPASEMTYTVSGGVLNSTQSNPLALDLSPKPKSWIRP